MPGVPAARMLMGGWFCSGVGVTEDALGECILVCVAVPSLSGHVPGRISIQGLTADLPAARDPGSSPRHPNRAGQAEFRNHACTGDNHTDGQQVERRRFVDPQLGAPMADMVPRCSVTRIWRQAEATGDSKHKGGYDVMISTHMLVSLFLALSCGLAGMSAVPASSDSAKSQVVERELRSKNIEHNKAGVDP